MTQVSNENGIEYRLASRDDETDILAVLEEVSSEIPVRLDGAERQEKIRTEITQCHETRKSWVAVVPERSQLVPQRRWRPPRG
jgi:hypothetical protein